MDISSLSTKQLEALLRAAQKEKQRKTKRRPIGAVRQLLEKSARASGYTLSEVFGMTTRAVAKKSAVASTRKKKTGATKVPPKYRNPADASQTWTGRGRQPRWLAAALKDGGDIEGYRVGTSD